MKPKTGRIMVVCSEANDELTARLACEGWRVTWVADAGSAIAGVRRERFDLVVLISTGKEMDIIETYFNLADIRRTLPVVFVCPNRSAYIPAEEDSGALSDTGLHAVRGVDGLIALLSKEKTAGSAARRCVVREEE